LLRIISKIQHFMKPSTWTKAKLKHGAQNRVLGLVLVGVSESDQDEGKHAQSLEETH